MSIFEAVMLEFSQVRCIVAIPVHEVTGWSEHVLLASFLVFSIPILVQNIKF